MFDYLYEWILNLAFYIILVTAVMHIIPNSDYKKYIHFFTGLVLILLILTPLLKLFGMEVKITEPFNSREYKEQLQKMKEMEQLPEEWEVKEDAAEVDEVKIGR